VGGYIKMNLRDTDYKDMKWIEQIQGRVSWDISVVVLMNLWIQ